MKPIILHPDPEVVNKTNLYGFMRKLGFKNYQDLWLWSVNEKDFFWETVLQSLEIPFKKKPSQILDLTGGEENPIWLKNARMNIVDACFSHESEQAAIVYQSEKNETKTISYKELLIQINSIAYSFKKLDLKKGDVVFLYLPMNIEAVSIYLAGIKAGLVMATIADSFSSEEISVRLGIVKPKLIVTQDFYYRNNKQINLYEKLENISSSIPVLILKNEKSNIKKRKIDFYWADFIQVKEDFNSVECSPEDPISILFSSGTTATPKAIPWNHTTPIKCASDGFFYQDIRKKDVVAWPTNLGWMMGPWLVFATLINKGTIALYGGSPLTSEFGNFIQNEKVNILGVVPTIVKHWKTSKTLENIDLSHLKCFSSTGEASNPDDYTYLMKLAQNKPIIEYCGGTEIGGGYLCSTLIQDNIPSTFSTKALGLDFIILGDNYQLSKSGEVFLFPPSIGLSQTLLNKNHHEIYYEGLPKINGKKLRKHGDHIDELENGYFKAQGRVDDTMNLGGIKVSSIQIEEIINQLDFVKESAAIAVPPKAGGPENLIVYYISNYPINSLESLSKISETVKKRINPLFKVFDVVLTDNLPRTASGKIMRRELRNAYVKNQST